MPRLSLWTHENPPVYIDLHRSCEAERSRERRPFDCAMQPLNAWAGPGPGKMAIGLCASCHATCTKIRPSAQTRRRPQLGTSGALALVKLRLVDRLSSCHHEGREQNCQKGTGSLQDTNLKLVKGVQLTERTQLVPVTPPAVVTTEGGLVNKPCKAITGPVSLSTHAACLNQCSRSALCCQWCLCAVHQLCSGSACLVVGWSILRREHGTVFNDVQHRLLGWRHHLFAGALSRCQSKAEDGREATQLTLCSTQVPRAANARLESFHHILVFALFHLLTYTATHTVPLSGVIFSMYKVAKLVDLCLLYRCTVAVSDKARFERLAVEAKQQLQTEKEREWIIIGQRTSVRKSHLHYESMIMIMHRNAHRTKLTL